MLSIVVSGGSRGLGLGIARKLVADGYRVLALARKMSAELGAAMDQANAGRPDALHFIPVDLGEIEAIADLVKRLRQDFGPLHGLVNNAATGTPGVLANMHPTQIEKLIRLNTLSPITLTKYVVRHMMADGGGRIVNVASIIGFTGYSGLSVYGATKAAMLGFTRSLAREVGSLGVNVNAVAPGFMQTEMTEGMGDHHRAQIARRSALGRFAEVDDVAAAVAFLLGPGGRSITGTVMTVDAGSTA